MGVRFLLVSGKPLKEPVAWYGPIVMNTNQELEAEFIAYAALGGSQTALASGVCGGVIGNLGAYAPVAGLDLPFGHISLNGIQLGLFGSTPGNQGLDELIEQFGSVMGKGTNSGTSQIFDTTTSPANDRANRNAFRSADLDRRL